MVVRKISQLTAAKLLKFHLPFISKLRSILFRNFSYWRLALCWVMLAMYKGNYHFFSFQKCSLSSRIVFIYDCALLW